MRNIFLAIAIITSAFFSLIGSALAAPAPAAVAPAAPASAGLGSAAAQPVKLQNPLKGNITDIPSLIGTIIKVAMGVLGALALFAFIWGGSTWILAAGSPEKIKSGTDTMLWAAIGIFLVFSSYIMVNGIILTLTR